MNLDLVARSPENILSQRTERRFLPNVEWSNAAFIVFWEGQSQVASLAYIGLVAFSSIWVALATMLVWSLVATVFFCAARERGYPNILTSKMPARRTGSHLAWFAMSSVGRAWLAGFHAFIFARCSSFLLTDFESACRVRRFMRLPVLAVGLTMFGVSTAEHLLRSAGYTGARLTRLGLIGPFLNVPYRVLLSAAVIALVKDSVNIL